MNFILGLIKLYFSPQKKYYLQLKNLLGFVPNNLTLYKSAFRHRSVATEIQKGIKNSNERLEYLGDAVLDTIIAEFLFKKFPYKEEGFLTEMRSKIVNRERLSGLAMKLGIDVLIQFDSQNPNPETEFKSLKGNALEALIGAMYLDKGYNFTHRFVCKQIIIPYIDIEELATVETNHKSKLIEWAQKEGKEIVFKVLEETGSANNKKYKVQVFITGKEAGIGIDYTKKKAEQIAAEKTFEELLKFK